MADNPDERFSDFDYAEAAARAEARAYPAEVTCELCGQQTTTVNAHGVCRWCEQIEQGDREPVAIVRCGHLFGRAGVTGKCSLDASHPGAHSDGHGLWWTGGQ